jgi:hypothetical protein
VKRFPLLFQLDSTFFGLTQEYKLGLTQEIYYLVKHMSFSYESVQNMPIYERRLYLDYWQKELEDKKKEYDKAKKRK